MHIQAYSQNYISGYTYQGIFAHIRAYFSRFGHIQGPSITDQNSVNQTPALQVRFFF